MNLYLLISAKKQILIIFNISFFWISLLVSIYHVSFYLMSSNIDIITAGISNFDDLTIFVMSFQKK